MVNENVSGEDVVAEELGADQRTAGQGAHGQVGGQSTGGQQASGGQVGGQQSGGQQASGQQTGGQQMGGQNPPGQGPQGQQYGGATGGPTSTGLSENVAGALSYLLGLLTGVLFFVLEKDNPFVRFHAAQSMVVSGGIFVLSIVLSIVGGVVTAVMFSGSTGGFLVGGVISLVLGLFWLVLSVVTFVAWLYLMYKAFKGETPRVPVAAGIADRLAN